MYDLVWHHGSVWAAGEAPAYFSVAVALRRSSLDRTEIALSQGEIEHLWKGETSGAERGRGRDHTGSNSAAGEAVRFLRGAGT